MQHLNWRQAQRLWVRKHNFPKGLVRKHLNAPDLSLPEPTPLVFVARLKTQAKPVVFTSQIAVYKSMERLAQ